MRSVNKLARSVTKWTQACDRLVKADFLHSSHERFQTGLSYAKHGTALQTGFVSRLRLCWRFEDSKSISGGVLCIFGSRTFVPVSWMCKKQTCISHSSTESEIISLDAGLRMDGLLALDLLDKVIEVLRSTNNNAQPKHTSHQEIGAVLDSKPKTQHVRRRQRVEQLSEVDYVPTNRHSSQCESQLYIFEDNEAVIKMIIKGRSPTMRHVSRSHSVALDWLFERINLESQIQIKYVDTKNQLADILTKGSFSKN